MTKEDIEMMKERFKQNDLYQQSTSPFKDFQMEQFYVGETILEGQNSKTMTIDGRDVVVIFNFSNGLIDSKDDQPDRISDALGILERRLYRKSCRCRRRYGRILGKRRSCPY